MKHLGDITKIDGARIEPVWCITFGSPCQDLSVAGKRAGLAGERSGLFMEAVRIIKEMRNGRVQPSGADGVAMPRYAIWENVPGAFSSNGGEDFRAVLEELCRVREPGITIPKPKKWEHAGLISGDGWSIAWRLFDAQYWGVPQRRKRVCTLCDFDGDTAGDILFTEHFGVTADSRGDEALVGTPGGRGGEVPSVGKSLRGHLEPSIEAWKGVARNPEECPGGSAFTVKIRGGVEADSNGRKAGKGALVQTEKSGTMGVTQDQTLFG